MAKYLLTLKSLDPEKADDVVAIAETLPEGNRPENPIVIPDPKPPLVIWGPDGPWVTPPIYLPPQKPGDEKPPIIWGPPDNRPTPPIVIPPLPMPPGIWGPPGPWVTPPIYLPGDGKPPVIGWDPCDGNQVTPPIYIPPQRPSGPNKPPAIWDPSFPTPPIEMPGDGKPPALGSGNRPGNPIAPTPEPKRN